MSHEPRLSLDHDEAAIERALDALGQNERASTPDGLDQRIADATAPLLNAGRASRDEISGAVRHAARYPANSGTSGPRGASHTHASRRASHVRLRWAVAAGLGATVCVTAWLALRGSAMPSAPIAHDPDMPGSPNATAIASSPEDEAEALFLASSMFDDNFDTALGEIATTAATLGLTLTDPLSGTGETWNTAEGESL